MSFLLKHKPIAQTHQHWSVLANLSELPLLFDKLDAFSANFNEQYLFDHNSLKLLLEEVFVNIVHYGQCEDTAVEIDIAFCTECM